MGTNAFVTIPETLEKMTARNVGLSMEEFSDEFAFMKQYGCWLVHNGIKFEASIKRESYGTRLDMLTIRMNTFDHVRALMEKLIEVYGKDNIDWRWTN